MLMFILLLVISIFSLLFYNYKDRFTSLSNGFIINKDISKKCTTGVCPLNK